MPYPVVKTGRRVTISGVTRPRVAHTQIRVGYAPTTGHRHGTIGAVQTHRRGQFTIHWRPRATGIYTITSALAAPAAGFLPDHNCDLALTVS